MFKAWMEAEVQVQPPVQKKDLATFAALQQRQWLTDSLCHFFTPLWFQSSFCITCDAICSLSTWTITICTFHESFYGDVGKARIRLTTTLSTRKSWWKQIFLC